LAAIKPVPSVIVCLRKRSLLSAVNNILRYVIGRFSGTGIILLILYTTKSGL